MVPDRAVWFAIMLGFVALAGCIGDGEDPKPPNADSLGVSLAIAERLYVLADDEVRTPGSLSLEEDPGTGVLLHAVAAPGWRAQIMDRNMSTQDGTLHFDLVVAPPEGAEEGTNATVTLVVEAGGAVVLEKAVLVGITDSFALSNFLTWDHAHLEILIIPPAHGPIANTEDGVLPYGPEGALPGGVYLDATLHAIDDWRYALDRVAENRSDIAWVKDITWDVKIVAEDIVTPEDIADADIIKLYTETTYPILGAAANTGGLIGDPAPGCVAYNTKWITYGSLTYVDMYALAGHELLHCFGMSHPDGMDPYEDIMSYESWPIPEIRCPSNLNVLAAAAAFRGAFDVETGPERGATVHVPQPAWEIYCDPDSDRLDRWQDA